MEILALLGCVVLRGTCIGGDLRGFTAGSVVRINYRCYATLLGQRIDIKCPNF